jgi:glycerol-3-phosphate dehydrogenase (NAD(P)+)
VNIAFIGMGEFGKAIASLVEHNGRKYNYAERTRLLKQPADLLFLTVPAQHMRRALTDNKPHISSETIIVNGTKGIEEGTHLMAHQIVRSIGRFPYYYSLIGPSFAKGVKEGDPTVASLGYKNPEHLDVIKKVLETSHFKVQPCKGYRALELASALKNLYAILCGFNRGVGLGPNTHARIITMALQEFITLAKAMKFHDYDPIASGVVGDLMLTCSSEQSRNFQYGLSLTKTDARQAPIKTVEGYHTSRSINAIAYAHQVELPLAELTSDIIKGKVIGKEAFIKRLAKV